MRAPTRSMRRPRFGQDDLRSSRILLVVRFTLLEDLLELGRVRQIDGASQGAEQRTREVERQLDRMPFEEIRIRAPRVQRQPLPAALSRVSGDGQRKLLVLEVRQDLAQHSRSYIVSAQEVRQVVRRVAQHAVRLRREHTLVEPNAAVRETYRYASRQHAGPGKPVDLAQCEKVRQLDILCPEHEANILRRG